MSDQIQPIAPISRVEPVSPVSGVRDTDTGLYQIFASQLARFFETIQEPHPLPPAPFFSGLVPLPPPPLRLRSKKMRRRKRGETQKVEAIFHSALG